MSLITFHLEGWQVVVVVAAAVVVVSTVTKETKDLNKGPPSGFKIRPIRLGYIYIRVIINLLGKQTKYILQGYQYMTALKFEQKREI